MDYTKEQLDQLKREIFAPAVIGSRVSLDRVHNEWEGLCPFHEERTPSFKVFKGKDDTWLATCHGACSKTWNVFQVLERIDKISFSEAVEKAKSIAQWEEGKSLAEKTFSSTLPAEKTLNVYPLSVLASAEAALAKTPEVLAWLLDERGITLETAQTLHLGYIQSAKAVSPEHPWVDRGWIVIPTIDDKKNITGLKYRSLVAKKQEVEINGKLKKISGILRGTNMLTSLYNLESVSSFDDVYVVEGEPDVWAMTQAGYSAVGYPSGSYNPTPEERDRLMRANHIFLAGDADSTGQDAMKKLWNELRDRTYLVEWPEGMKDANQTLKEYFNGNTEQFQAYIERAKMVAQSKPIPDFYDLRFTLQSQNSPKPMDNPKRLHFRHKCLDEMAIILPGNVVSVFATYTGTGKTTWVLDSFELEEVLNHGSVVLNYSAELSPAEFGTLVTANLLEKDRNMLEEDDYKAAGLMLQDAGAKFYVGYNPDLSRIGQVLDSIEWAIKRLGANIVVLDHLHFLTRGERDDIKAQSDAMQRIKNLAVKYQVIFVVVGQSRKQQQNNRGRASVGADAKGSESFTSDASAVFLIHRNLNTRDATGQVLMQDRLDTTTNVTLEKVRTKGPGPAECKMVFVGTVGKFYPMTQQEQQ